MPSLRINIDFGIKYTRPEQILNKDLFRLTGKKLEDLPNVSIGKINALGYDLILVPDTSPVNAPDYCQAASNGVEFFVDPLKYEPRPLLSDSEIDGLKDKYNICDEKVVVAGSIKPDEVASVHTAVKYAMPNFEDVKLLLVPRKMPRQVQEVLSRLKIQYNTDKKIGDANVVVVTEEGVLQDLYSICDVAFIGDTLWNTPRGGGQNPLEPAFYNKRIICGDNWENNEDAYVGLRSSGLLIQVADQDELNSSMKTSLNSGPPVSQVKAAQDFIKSRQGASEKYARFIRDTLYSRN